MNELLEQLIEDRDRLIDEVDVKKGLKIAAAGLIGGAGMLGMHAASTPFRYPVKKDIGKPGVVTPVDKRAEDEGGVEATLKSHFPREYETIKIAADRNGCRGEDLVILFAIRKAENGPPGLEFGVMHPKAKNTDLNTQASWAAATVVKNRRRWIDSGKEEDFITFLGRRYCPVGAENDPSGLNRHWIGNVKSWVRKLSR